MTDRILRIFTEKMAGKLYMIPNTLGDTGIAEVLPLKVTEVIRSLDYFIVENLRNARRFMIKCGYEKSIDAVVFYELNQHTKTEDIPEFLRLCIEGKDCGIISEAGIPGIADPGAEVVAIAHKSGIQVVPLSGPSSIYMALMASGLNGQSFAFHGYLPPSNPERSKKIKDLESTALKSGQSQIFMETPYRNEALLADILKSCNGNTLLCIACDISLSTEDIRTMPVAFWQKAKAALHKRPCIFILNKQVISR